MPDLNSGASQNQTAVAALLNLVQGVYTLNNTTAAGAATGTTDNTAPISAYIVTKRYNFGFDNIKKFTRLNIDWEGQGTTASKLYYKWSTSPSVAYSTPAYVTIGTTPAIVGRQYSKLRLSDATQNTQGQFIQYHLDNASDGTNFHVYKIDSDYKIGKVRGT